MSSDIVFQEEEFAMLYLTIRSFGSSWDGIKRHFPNRSKLEVDKALQSRQFYKWCQDKSLVEQSVKKKVEVEVKAPHITHVGTEVHKPYFNDLLVEGTSQLSTLGPVPSDMTPLSKDYKLTTEAGTQALGCVSLDYVHSPTPPTPYFRPISKRFHHTQPLANFQVPQAVPSLTSSTVSSSCSSSLSASSITDDIPTEQIKVDIAVRKSLKAHSLGQIKALETEGYHTETQRKGNIAAPPGSYAGEWKDGVPSGYGVYTFQDNSKYSGEVRDGKLSGYGILMLSSGRVVYQGEWDNNNIEGYGRMFHPAVYEGTPVEQGKFVNNVCQEPVRQPLFESHMKRKVVEPIPSETAQISASHCKISKSMGSEGVTKIYTTGRHVV